MPYFITPPLVYYATPCLLRIVIRYVAAISLFDGLSYAVASYYLRFLMPYVIGFRRPCRHMLRRAIFIAATLLYYAAAMPLRALRHYFFAYAFFAYFITPMLLLR